jgi:hypothetical protein
MFASSDVLPAHPVGAVLGIAPSKGISLRATHAHTLGVAFKYTRHVVS